MSDLIDRHAAIDALMEKDKKLRNINWYDKPYAEGECRGIDEALSIISNLPSAQPTQTNTFKALETLDCISRQAAIDNLISFLQFDEEYAWGIRECLNALPTADVQEVKHGKWEKMWHSYFKQELPCCSVCGHFSAMRWKYCPNCGADMRKETEDAVH